MAPVHQGITNVGQLNIFIIIIIIIMAPVHQCINDAGQLNVFINTPVEWRGGTLFLKIGALCQLELEAARNITLSTQYWRVGWPVTWPSY